MFDNIEQGVEVYKERVKDFLTCGGFDRKEEIKQQLEGMEASLGLDWGEAKEIRSIIEQDLLA